MYKKLVFTFIAALMGACTPRQQADEKTLYVSILPLRSLVEEIVGDDFKIEVLAGFVNGFFPSRDYFDATVMTPDKQKLARATDIRRLYAAAGKPTERLVASWFTSIDLVGAEQLKLEIGRVRLRRGERIATTSPSIYLKEIEPTEDQSA